MNSIPTADSAPSATESAPVATVASHPLAPPPSGLARKGKQTLASGMIIGGAVVIGGGVFVYAALRALDDGATTGQVAGMVFALVICVWLQTLIHEAGHALAALSRGYRALAFGVGPLRLDRGQSGWRFHIARNVEGVGGFASLLPPLDAPNSRLDEAIYVAGGPLANLLAAAPSLAVLAWIEPGTPAATMIWSFVALSVLIGVANLMPFASFGFRSDGLKLLDLWRCPELFVGQRKLHYLGSLSSTGVRPRDWPKALIPAIPGKDADPQLRRDAALMRLHHALDDEQTEMAREAAATLVEDWATAPDGIRQWIAVALAGHAALIERDPALIEAWLTHAEGGLFDQTARRRWLAAEAAALRGDLAGARLKIAEARAALGRVHELGEQTGLVAVLAALEARIDTVR